MAFVTLATKVRLPPKRPESISRPMLVKRLCAGLSKKLTLICAPAGYGKSTLAREWAASSGRLVAWLAVDREDRPVVRFLTYLVAALKSVLPGIPDLSVSQPRLSKQNIESILIALINEASRSPRPILLVIDDLHLAESPELTAALGFLIRHLPAELHLALVTRLEPQLPLSTYRLRGEVLELSARDLAFSYGEALTLFRRTDAGSPGKSKLEDLLRTTEGWPAGVQAATIALNRFGRLPTWETAAGSSERDSFSFLRREVLEANPRATRAFLLRTSILDELCAPLCHELLGHDHFDLGQIEHDGLFLIPLDNEGYWYRYHHLFQAMLQEVAARELGEEVLILHERASRWHHKNGHPTRAGKHSVASGNSHLAAVMLERAWREMSEGAHLELWEQWAASVPADVESEHPMLNAQRAYVEMNRGQLDNAEARLRRAAADQAGLEAAACRNSESEGAQLNPLLAPFLAIGHAFVAQARGDQEATVRWARSALAHESPGDALHSSQAHALLGLAHWSRGKLDLAHAEYSETLRELERYGSLGEVLSVTFVLAEIMIARGFLGEAHRVCARAVENAGEENRRATGLEDVHRVLAEIEADRGDDDLAIQHLERATEVGRTSLAIGWQRRHLSTAAWLHVCRGDGESALRVIEEADRAQAESPLPEQRPLPAMRARALLALGKPQAAADAIGRFDPRPESVVGQDFARLTEVRVLLNTGNEQSLRKARELLDARRAPAITGGRRRTALEIELLTALVAVRSGQREDARASFENAVKAASEERHLGPFLEERDAVAALMMDVGHEFSASEFLAPLRAQVCLAAPGSMSLENGETLTERECDVLSLVADGLSNAEICERLHLALDTVKGYNRRIFEKLEVKRRTQAVAKARDLGFIQR